MKNFKKHFTITLLLISILFSNSPYKTADAAAVNGMTKEIKTLFKNFLNDKPNVYFKVISMKGTDKPVLLVSDERLSNKTIIDCDIYIVKSTKKKNQNKLVKVGNIKSLSSGYYIWQYNKQLICGSHHYTAYAEIKNDKLYVNCYQGRINKEEKELFYHSVYINGKLMNEKQISSSKGKDYVYKMWDKQEKNTWIISYKNTENNRKKYI